MHILLSSTAAEQDSSRVLLALGILEVKEKGKAVAPHSSALAWRIPWTQEPGGLQPMESLGVGYD